MYRPRCWRVGGIRGLSRKILKNQVPILKGFSRFVGLVHVTGSSTQQLFHLLLGNIRIHLVNCNFSKAKPGCHSFTNFRMSYGHQRSLLPRHHELENNNYHDRYRELPSSSYLLDCESFEVRLHCVLHITDSQIIVGCCRKAEEGTINFSSCMKGRSEPLSCKTFGVGPVRIFFLFFFLFAGRTQCKQLKETFLKTGTNSQPVSKHLA